MVTDVVNIHRTHRHYLEGNMTPCSAKKSTSLLHSNIWENCDYDRGYEAFYRFNKEQFYNGEFFRDGLHGQGSYTWNNVAVYEGGFYSNHKEGYACLSLPDNSFFEGLFIKNEPFGPGILTHANGRQDAGFWVGRKLVRLSRAVDFIIPRLAPTPAAKLKLLQFKRLIPLPETKWDLTADVLKKCGYPFEHFYSPYSSLIYDPRSMFFDSPAFEKTYFINFKEVLKEFPDDQKSLENEVNGSEAPVEDDEKSNNSKEKPVPAHCLCQQDEFVMEYKNQESFDICDRESTEGEYEMGILTYLTKFGTIEGLQKNLEDDYGPSENLSATGEDEEETRTESRPPNIVSWNRSELCTEMLKQIFRHRAFEEKLNFNLAKLMLGVRTAFRRTGIKEKQCLQFLKMCSIGPAHVVKDFLCNFEISEELMDARGNNSLMFAAASDQHEIIDILLDYGVDVNTFNDENLTPLNLCLLRRLAQVNGISSWETAFLPKEIDVPPHEFPQSQEWETQVSITSLDRIFGDGMSLNDSKSRIFENRLMTQFPAPSFFRESSEIAQMQHNRFSDESRDLSDLSQITILNLSKSPGSHVLIHSAHDVEPGNHFNIRKSSSTSAVRETKEECLGLGSNEETPRINIKLVPKSNKGDEYLRSIKKCSTDTYMFEVTFQKKPSMSEIKKTESSGRSNKRGSKQIMEERIQEDEKESGETPMERKLDFELTKKIANIDKTIQKLLRRGADPNISEVPKPSIHLGVYTKDLNTVYNLLLYGANPNSQLYSNEGLLTPLHIVVLQPSARENVDICELLLNFDANPEKQTHHDFFISEEEKMFLDPHRGRTPLQLLCMRPDLEYADPEDNFIKIGLLLAKKSNRKCLYNGHSCLTLAMLFGNIKLLRALLESYLFDPNDILEKDRGTALHVLVSTELQKKTSFEDSIKMCDLLIAAGANPLKKLKRPKSLLGNCVDYGYREIEAEREARKTLEPVKKDTKKIEKAVKEKLGKEKSISKDYLQDHEKVVEYLGEIISEKMGTKKLRKKRKGGDANQDSSTEDLKAHGAQVHTRRAGKENEETAEVTEYEKGKTKKKDTEREDRKGKTKKKDTEREDRKGKKQEEGKEKTEKGLHDSQTPKGDNEFEKVKGKKGRSENGGNEIDLDKGKKRKAKGEGEDEEEKKRGGKNGRKNKFGEEESEEKEKKSKHKTKKGKDKEERQKGTGDNKRNDETKNLEKYSKKDQQKLKEKDLNLQSKSSFKHPSTKQLGARSETFPEKIRQNLLQMYGNCVNVDINEFLVPYVVLRDGELYYRFQGKTSTQKEQYSLI